MKNSILVLVLLVVISGCKTPPKESEAETNATEDLSPTTAPFPGEIIDFEAYESNPIFKGTDTTTWDRKIRERGFILREEDGYHMWYTGYSKGGSDDTLALGYATSIDGLAWVRYDSNPIFKERWTEDMMVIKEEDTYHMFAEGRGDIAHRLTSADRIHWEDHGSLDIRTTQGKPIDPGPYGTPTVWRERGIWYLFYERGDLGIWLATSQDLLIWQNVQDDPVIEMGPEPYDKYGLAVNQIIKYQDWYYAYYHGTAFEDWSEWSTNVAASKDLIRWEKYPQNPIMGENKSSGILVHDGQQYRLYTMHDQVAVHFPK